MDFITVKARAKLNLSLDVKAKRPDGYHEVCKVMQTIALHDVVSLEKTERGLEVTCNNPKIPMGNGNIAYRAAQIMVEKYEINSGIKITIDKRIPVAAGLAGGSADAAAVLKGINALFSLGLQQHELMDVGKCIGADVPFCIKGGTVLAEGIGEILTELVPLPEMSIVLVTPKIEVPTAWVYNNLDLNMIQSRPNTYAIINAVEKRDINALAKNMINVLETVTVPRYGIIEEIKTRLVNLGAAGSIMSGSGPSVFGVFTDAQKAKNAYSEMKDDRWDCFLTHAEKS